LDAGPVPTGRHLLSGRDPDGVQLVAGPPGSLTRIVLSHLESADGGFTTTRISTVDDLEPAGAPAASSRPLLDGVLNCGGLPPCTVVVDNLGRLYLDQVTYTPSTDPPGNVDQTDELVRVDPETGATQNLGVENGYFVSADGTRFAFLSTANQMWTVVGVDGDETSVTAPTGVMFVGGNDLFFVSADGHLMHLPPGIDVPEPVAANVTYFDPYYTQRGPLLLLARATGTAPPYYSTSYVTSLFDVLTLTETALPPATATAWIQPSPSGRYLTSQTQRDFSGVSPTIATLFDRDTSQEVTTSIPPDSTPFLAWRPQYDEVWYVGGADLWRWEPDGPPTEFGQVGTIQFYYKGGESVSPLGILGNPSFTPDGKFFLDASTEDDHGNAAVFLRSADDASAVPYPLNPAATGLAGLWPLLDGRLLLEASISDGGQNDIYLVDPTGRTTKALASTGHVVATGHDRCLALLHWLTSGSGDLTLVDYATGAETLIAENVFSYALDVSPVAGDALAPGTRVVYLVRNRIASPYDGLWAINLP
jgi:hypothetical protein